MKNLSAVKTNDGGTPMGGKVSGSSCEDRDPGADAVVDVAVIGGGVIGCFTAFFLARKGCRVTILERQTIGSGASTGNCGYVCPSHVLPLGGPGVIRHTLPNLLMRRGALSIPMRFDPLLWKWLYQFANRCSASHQAHAASARDHLLKYSMDLYRSILVETGLECGWTDKGLLMVHRSQRTFDEFATTADRLEREFGISPRPYGSSALHELEPSLVEGLGGGWHFEADAHLHPGLLMRELKGKLIEMGVNVREGVEVMAIHVSDGSVTRLQTSAGPITADQYVITMGAESPRFARPLGCSLPVVPGKGYSMNYPATDGTPQLPMIFEDSHVAVTPLGDTLRIGSTMVLSGYDRSIDQNRVRRIHADAQSYIASPLPAQPQQAWSGWRPMTPDDLPFIGRAPLASNAWVATGNGMIGISTAPATAQTVCEMLCGEKPTIDPAPYSLDRFSNRRRVPIAKMYQKIN